MSKEVCFITSIYGNYESSCKPFVKQTYDSDFICFTDNPNIVSNNWIIDTNPYHLTHPSPLDNDNCINSLKNNKHKFNIAKYYKQAFQNIPRLKEYKIIIWIDGTIEIIFDRTAECISYQIRHKINKIVGWSHEYREGFLSREVEQSKYCGRYTTTKWNNQSQPYQDIELQYKKYQENGYDDYFFKHAQSPNKNYGVWITCFIAFANHDSATTDFLNEWYYQTLNYTTQDQISFSYTVWKKEIWSHIVTFPNEEVSGDSPHYKTEFYIKHEHNK